MTPPKKPRLTLRRCPKCGYSKTYRSPELAAYHFGKHSCAKRHRAAESRARGQARTAAVDRTPKPCLHKIANHQHGTHACYVLDRCKCGPCTKANSEYEHDRSRAHAYGRFVGLVDAEPTRAHVRELMAAGIGLKRISILSGCSGGILNKLVYGMPSQGRPPCRRIRWETAVKLQVVQPGPGNLAGGAHVDATGTRRRVQALVALGWSQSKICVRLGMERGNFWRSMERSPRITAKLARDVAALYDELWDQAPPEGAHRDKIAASRARNYARRAGWPPPLAWDEDTIDDPAALPDAEGKPKISPVADGWDELDAAADVEDLDEIAVERIMAGTYVVPKFSRAPELVEAIRRLAAAGLSDAEMGERIGRDNAGVLKIRTRNAIPTGVPARNPHARRKAPTQPIDGIAARQGHSQSVSAAATPGRPESQPAA